MITEIKIDLDDANKIVTNKGLGQNGEVQKFVTSELMRISAPYTPFDNGILLAMAKQADDGTAILYNASYSRLHWYGKLMVDPKTGKGAFFSPEYGFWSRPGAQKVLSERDMTYQGAPTRGPKWVERAYIDNKATFLTSIEDHINKGGK